MGTVEYAELVPEPDEKVAAPQSDKSFIEQLLSPVMLQRMMGCGGAVLVLGVVGWLWSMGVFNNPLVAAAVIGIATFSVLGAGIALVKKSKHQLAGNGLTLLAVLAMPLNLWFYDAQGLITISNGGHLWIPAAICCAIYAFIARTLRNPMFVYTLVGGVVMTGMLFLADRSVDCFWRLLPPVSFLLSVGWLSFFAERLFPDDQSDFSRDKFGFAFRIAGLVVMVGGFVLLAAGQLAGPLSSIFRIVSIPLIATDPVQKCWAVGLLLASACGFAADRLIGKGVRASTPAAIALAAWAGLCGIEMLDMQLRLPHFAILFGIYRIVTWWNAKPRTDSKAGLLDFTLGREDLILPLTALSLMGMLQFAGQFVVSESQVVFSTNALLVAVQMLVTAAVFYVGWRKLSEFNQPTVSCLVASSVFAVLGTLSAVLHFEFASFDLIAAATLVVPVAFVSVGLVFAKPERTAAWQESAIAGVWFAMVSLLAFSTDMAPNNVHGSACWISAVGAAVMFAGSYGRASAFTARLSYLMAAVSASQLLCMFGVSMDYALVLSATIAGLVLAGTGFAIRRGDETDSNSTTMADRFEEPGNTLVLVGAMSGVLLALNRLLGQEASLRLLGVLGFLLASVVIVGLMTKKKSWRAAFRATSVANVLSCIVIGNSFLAGHWLQRVELGALLSGLTLLVIGHIGWYREGDREDEGATLALWIGSILIAVPLSLGLLFYRSFEVESNWNWWFFHEATTIAAALLLLGVGMACQIRSTTISGTALLTVYVSSLLVLVQWPDQLKSVSFVMMVGGGVFFLLAIGLSVYRDRLISVPDDIRAGRGMFRVMRWR